jgi:hypothetical protein
MCKNAEASSLEVLVAQADKQQGDGSRKKKLCGLSPRANYTDWATAACRRS